ncbi:MAG TPA: histidine phosphatase family protein, partial [Aminivibrio sp.]
MKGHERTTILLARHGECRGNVEGLFRGRVDFPLNERGLRQAAELGSALRPYSPEAVMTSPLLRAKDTARAIAGACSIRVEEDEGFNNISLGIWEGQPKTEIAERYPGQWKIWLENPERLAVEGAESLDDVLRRSMAALDR